MIHEQIERYQQLATQRESLENVLPWVIETIKKGDSMAELLSMQLTILTKYELFGPLIADAIADGNGLVIAAHNKFEPISTSIVDFFRRKTNQYVVSSAEKSEMEKTLTTLQKIEDDLIGAGLYEPTPSHYI